MQPQRGRVWQTLGGFWLARGADDSDAMIEALCAEQPDFNVGITSADGDSREVSRI